MARNEQAIVEIILKGQAANASLKDMEKASRALAAQLKALPKDSAEFASKAKEFQRVNADLKTMKQEAFGVGQAFKNAAPKGMFDNLKQGALSVFGGNLLTRGASAITGVFNDAIDAHRKFEKSVQNLSAITGASGKDLEFYKDKARELGLTVEGGAEAVVEAFKFIGSAKPELLENKEALAQVTEQAILLSKAAGLDLPEASKRLTDAMNQFGADASEAAKYVDTLAAGAKFGAAEVPEVTDALLKFGVAAKSSNISIYESVAAIELLGEKGLKGAEAGTQLRNVLAKLAAADALPQEALDQLKAAGVNTDILSNKNLTLQQRLTELSKIQGNATAITKVFGLENKAAGETIISNLGRLEQLTKQVKQTGSAKEQAAKNTDTFDQALVEAKNAYNDMLLTITEGDFGEVLKDFVKVGGQALRGLGQTANLVGRIFREGLFDAINNDTEEFAKDFVYKKVVEDGKKISAAKRQQIAEALQLDVKYLNIQLQNNASLTEDQRERYLEQIKSKANAADALLSIDRKQKSDTIDNKSEEANQVRKIDTELQKKLLAERKKFLDELAALEKKYKSSQLSDRQREEKEILDRYSVLLAKTKEGSIEQLKLRQFQNAELETLDKKYSDKAIADKKALEQEITRATNSEQQNRIDDVEAFYNDLIAKARAGGMNAAVAELEAAKEAKKQEIYASGRTSEGNAPNQFLGNKSEPEWRTELNEAIGIYEQFYSRVNALLEQQKANNLAAAEAEMTNNQINMEEQLGREKRLLNAKVISQEEYDKRVDQLDKDRKKKDAQAKREAAERNKRISLFQATVSGAVSIVKTLAEYAYPYNLIFAALDAAVVGAQIASINSQQIPAFAKGGFSNNPSGYVNQPTVFTNSASGQPFLAGEAGSEYIVPSWMLENPVIANTVDMMEGIRTRGYATGGYNNMPAGTAAASGSNKDLMNVLGTLANVLQNGVPAYLNYDVYNTTNDRINASKEAAQVK